MADLSKELAAVLRVDTGLQTPPTTPRERVPYEDLLAYTSEWPAAQGANSIQVMMLENALGLDPGSPAPASPEPEPVYDALAGVYPWERAVSVPAPVFDLGAAGAPPVATAGLPLCVGPSSPPHCLLIDGRTPPPTLGRRARVWRPRLAWPHGRRFAKAPVKKTRKDVSASKKEALRKSLDLARRCYRPQRSRRWCPSRSPLRGPAVRLSTDVGPTPHQCTSQCLSQRQTAVRTRQDIGPTASTEGFRQCRPGVLRISK